MKIIVVLFVVLQSYCFRVLAVETSANSTLKIAEKPEIQDAILSPPTKVVPIVTSEDKGTAESSFVVLKFPHQELLENNKKSKTLINSGLASKASSNKLDSSSAGQEKVYSFQLPLNENERETQFGNNNPQKNSPFSSGGIGNRDETLENYIARNFEDRKQLIQRQENNYTVKGGKNGRKLYGNDSEIQGTGTGFHHLPHPQIQIHPELLEHQQRQQLYNPNQDYLINQHVEIQPEILPQHQIVNQDEGQFHQHLAEGIHQYFPVPRHELIEENLKNLPKQLKPSIVHRDPHDRYNHHDKIRTQDKDAGLSFYAEPHNPVHDHLNGQLTHQQFQPYDYDMKKTPECAFKNKHFYNLTFCLEDHLYPLETILWALHQAGDLVEKILTDVTYQSADNLVTGLTREEEEGYNYKHYFGSTHAQHTALEQYKPPYHGYTYKTDYFKKGGYICPSDIYYGRPRRAMNTFGQWKVIVNIDHIPKVQYIKKRDTPRKRETHYPYEGVARKNQYTQTLRIEQCIYPNAPCSYINPLFHSRCIQKHNFVRLAAWTMEEGLHVDTFKLPVACSCHIPQPIHFYQETGHQEHREGSVLLAANNHVNIVNAL